METLTMDISLHRAAGVEWSVVSQPSPGESVSGDEHVVVPSRDGLLLAVIDGLGHGEEATLAARKAADVLAQHADDGVIALVQQCHRALRDTRGAAMTVIALNRREGTATALGIGNVETVLVRANRQSRPRRESVLLRNGVVGYNLPVLQTGVHAIHPGDVVVFATDGVREDFGDTVDAAQPLPQLVEQIVARKRRGHDDALVLACKILDDNESA
jgi:hypothetical protein